MSEKKKSGGGQADGTRRSYFMLPPDQYTIIGLDTDDGPKHPQYDERINLPVSDALVKNIQVHGVLEPILFERDGKRNIVIDGRQRVRAARAAVALQRAAGEVEVEVPGIPKRGDESHLYGVQLSANIHQADNALTSARKAQRMIDMGKSDDAVATALGVTTQTLKAWLSLLSAAPEVRKAVERGSLSSTAATALTKLPKAEQAAKLAELTAGGAKPTAAEVTNKVRKATGKAPVESPAAKLTQIRSWLANHMAGGITKDQLITKLCVITAQQTKVER